MTIPYVIEQTGNGERSYDIYSRLLKDRIIMINGEIEPQMAGIIVSELLYLQSESATAPINLYISSPGGWVTAGYSIISTMRLIKPPVYVTAHGSIASMASVIFSCGEKGHRYILPNTRVMLHQVSSGTDGNVQDMRLALQESERLNVLLLKTLADNCGKTQKEMEKITSRDYWMDEYEAIKFGIADKILEKEA